MKGTAIYQPPTIFKTDDGDVESAGIRDSPCICIMPSNGSLYYILEVFPLPISTSNFSVILLI